MKCTRQLFAFSAIILCSLAARLSADETDRRFVVHEWGVLVLNSLDTGIELGPPAAMPGQLPAFVLRHDQAYKPKRQNLGWDKPVIHFYGPEGLLVQLNVGTPLGKPMAYWPPPLGYVEKAGKPISSRQEMMVYTLSEAQGMQWAGTLSAKPAVEPVGGDPKHWWNDIRGVPSMWFNTKAVSERFVFYEATARQQPVVNAAISAESLTLVNSGGGMSGQVVVLVNDGKTRWGLSVESIAAGQSVVLKREVVQKQARNEEQTLAACAKQWSSMGMTDEEAAAIVKVWRPDLLDTLGVMVIARMPSASYEKMFPLSITPKPDEQVRVGLVFDALAGQDGRAAWLPGLKPTVEEWGKGLAAGAYKQREEAAARFERLGDLSRPFLKELASGGNPEASRAAAVLLSRMEGPSTRPATSAVPKR